MAPAADGGWARRHHQQRSIRMDVGVKTTGRRRDALTHPHLGVLDQVRLPMRWRASFRSGQLARRRRSSLKKPPHQPGGPTVATVPAAAGGGRGRGRTGAGVRVLSARPVTVRLVEVVVSLRLPEEKGPAPWPSQRNSHVRNLVLLDDQSTSPQRVNPILSGLV